MDDETYYGNKLDEKFWQRIVNLRSLLILLLTNILDEEKLLKIFCTLIEIFLFLWKNVFCVNFLWIHVFFAEKKLVQILRGFSLMKKKIDLNAQILIYTDVREDRKL